MCTQLHLSFISLQHLFSYLEMRNEVGRDAPFRLDSGATRLTVGLDFAIFPFKHNIKVIQDGYLGH